MLAMLGIAALVALPIQFLHFECNPSPAFAAAAEQVFGTSIVFAILCVFQRRWFGLVALPIGLITGALAMLSHICP